MHAGWSHARSAGRQVNCPGTQRHRRPEAAGPGNDRTEVGCHRRVLANARAMRQGWAAVPINLVSKMVSTGAFQPNTNFQGDEITSHIDVSVRVGSIRLSYAVLGRYAG